MPEEAQHPPPVTDEQPVKRRPDVKDGDDEEPLGEQSENRGRPALQTTQLLHWQTFLQEVNITEKKDHSYKPFLLPLSMNHVLNFD